MLSIHDNLDVEDGHTLHLVVREPIPPSGSMNDSAGFAPSMILDMPTSTVSTTHMVPIIDVFSFDVGDNHLQVLIIHQVVQTLKVLLGVLESSLGLLIYQIKHKAVCLI